MKTLATLLTLAALSLPAIAADTISSHYIRTGVAETVIAPFTSPSTQTQAQFSGPVEIIVDGTGWSNGNRLNDAFYNLADTAPNNGWYRLNLGWDGADLVRLVENRNINRFISFIDGTGSVTYGTTPAYASDHIYRFVIDAPLTATRLQFGVSDGNFGDNGGQFRIAAYQLQPIPEPETWALMLTGLVLMGVRASQRKKKLA